MDAAGARHLRWRIEQQQHWRQAPAVLDGRQASVDPDLEELTSVGDGIRVYSERRTGEGRILFCKRLVAGVWENGSLPADHELPAGETSAELPVSPAPESAEVARVAHVA